MILKAPGILGYRGLVLVGKGLAKAMAMALLLAFSCRLSCPIRPLAFSVPLGLALEKGLGREMARAGALYLSCSCRQFYPVHPLLLSVLLELLAAVRQALATLKRWEYVFDAVLVQVQNRSLMQWLRLPLKAIPAEQGFSFWVFAWVVMFCLCHVGTLVWEGFLVAR